MLVDFPSEEFNRNEILLYVYWCYACNIFFSIQRNEEKRHIRVVSLKKFNGGLTSTQQPCIRSYITAGRTIKQNRIFLYSYKDLLFKMQ